jgi:uncharacterized protein
MPARRQSPFLFDLSAIPAEGHKVHLDLASWGPTALAEEVLSWKVGKLAADVTLYKSGERDVVAHGRIAGELITDCARCTTDATLRVDAPYDTTFVPMKEVSGTPGEHEMKAGEAELAGYTNEEIDLEQSLREQLILALPYAPLCKDDCRGLCGRCGSDLNEGPCKCPPEPKIDESLPKAEDKRWAALKNVKL